MNYGITYTTAFTVITHSNPSQALAWATSFESSGVFNYQDEIMPPDTHKTKRRWRFSKQEDAIVFALKFK